MTIKLANRYASQSGGFGTNLVLGGMGQDPFSKMPRGMGLLNQTPKKPNPLTQMAPQPQPGADLQGVQLAAQQSMKQASLRERVLFLLKRASLVSNSGPARSTNRNQGVKASTPGVRPSGGNVSGSIGGIPGSSPLTISGPFLKSALASSPTMPPPGPGSNAGNPAMPPPGPPPMPGPMQAQPPAPMTPPPAPQQMPGQPPMGQPVAGTSPPLPPPKPPMHRRQNIRSAVMQLLREKNHIPSGANASRESLKNQQMALGKISTDLNSNSGIEKYPPQQPVPNSFQVGGPVSPGNNAPRSPNFSSPPVAQPTMPIKKANALKMLTSGIKGVGRVLPGMAVGGTLGGVTAGGSSNFDPLTTSMGAIGGGLLGGMGQAGMRSMGRSGGGGMGRTPMMANSFGKGGRVPIGKDMPIGRVPMQPMGGNIIGKDMASPLMGNTPGGRTPMTPIGGNNLARMVPGNSPAPMAIPMGHGLSPVRSAPGFGEAIMGGAGRSVKLPNSLRRMAPDQAREAAFKHLTSQGMHPDQAAKFSDKLFSQMGGKPTRGMMPQSEFQNMQKAGPLGGNVQGLGDDFASGKWGDELAHFYQNGKRDMFGGSNAVSFKIPQNSGKPMSGVAPGSSPGQTVNLRAPASSIPQVQQPASMSQMTSGRQYPQAIPMNQPGGNAPMARPGPQLMPGGLPAETNFGGGKRIPTSLLPQAKPITQVASPSQQYVPPVRRKPFEQKWRTEPPNDYNWADDPRRGGVPLPPIRPLDIKYSSDALLSKLARDRELFLDSLFSKGASQDNSKPQRSSTGESEGLAYQSKPDHYAQGQEAWKSVTPYFKGSKYLKKDPDPFKGTHSGNTKRAFSQGESNQTAQPSKPSKTPSQGATQAKTPNQQVQQPAQQAPQGTQRPNKPHISNKVAKVPVRPPTQGKMPNQMSTPMPQGMTQGPVQAPQAPQQVPQFTQVPSPPNPMGQPQMPQQAVGVPIPVPVPTRVPTNREMVDYGQPKLQKQLTQGTQGVNSQTQGQVTQMSNPGLPRQTQTAPMSPQAQALAQPTQRKSAEFMEFLREGELLEKMAENEGLTAGLVGTGLGGIGAAGGGYLGHRLGTSYGGWRTQPLADRAHDLVHQQVVMPIGRDGDRIMRQHGSDVAEGKFMPDPFTRSAYKDWAQDTAGARKAGLGLTSELQAAGQGMREELRAPRRLLNQSRAAFNSNNKRFWDAVGLRDSISQNILNKGRLRGGRLGAMGMGALGALGLGGLGYMGARALQGHGE